MKSIFIVIILLLLTGCETIKVEQETRYVDAAIRSGEAQEVIMSVDLTTVQIMRLTRALNDYNDFKGKWKGFASKPVEILEKNIPDLRNDLENLNDHVTKIEKDITENWNKYSPEKQKVLLEYEVHIDRLSEAIKKHYRYEQYVGMLQLSLEYAKVLARVAIQVGGVI